MIKKHKFAVLMSIRNEAVWMNNSLKMLYEFVDYEGGVIGLIAITRGLTSWRNGYKNLDNTEEIIASWIGKFERRGVKIVFTTVDKPDSDEFQRNICLNIIKDKGYEMMLILDPDEFYHLNDLKKMFNQANMLGSQECGQVYVYAKSFWKGMTYCCGVERFGPVIARVDDKTKFSYIRNLDQDNGHTFDFFVYHMTAVKTNEQMEEKIKGWSHSHEVVKDWWNKKWLAWNVDRMITNLHPVSPELWPRTVKIDRRELPVVLHDHPYFQRDTVS